MPPIFTTLPDYVRDKIYKYTLVFEKQMIWVPSGFLDASPFPRTRQVHSSKDLSILRVSKKCHKETHLIFYTYNVFNINAIPRFQQPEFHRYHMFWHAVPGKNASWIRHIRMTFPVNSSDESTITYDVEINEVTMATIRMIQARCANVQKLTFASFDHHWTIWRAIATSHKRADLLASRFEQFKSEVDTIPSLLEICIEVVAPPDPARMKFIKRYFDDWTVQPVWPPIASEGWSFPPAIRADHFVDHCVR